MSEPIVLVLAGGASNRFWPLRDKPLLPFGQATLLERHVRQLKVEGLNRFVVVARPETADRAAAVLAAAGVEGRVAVQPEAKGMADAVLRAGDAIGSFGGGALYVTQSQDVVEPALHRRLLDAWSRRPASVAGLIGAYRVRDYFPGGYLTLDGERLTGVVEKPGAGNEPSDLVNIVAHLFASHRDLIDQIEAETAMPGADDAYERALSRLMAQQELRAVVYEGRWQALKYPWQVLDVMELLLERWTAGLESPGEGYEQREDGVFVAPDVRIFPGAHVVAPALLGPGVVVGHNALVRGSIIGPRCVVGFGSEVARSYLGEGVELHHNYVGDSVLDRDTALGYGTVTANYRLDSRSVPMFVGSPSSGSGRGPSSGSGRGERLDTGRTKLGLILGAGSRLGVNASTMPGVKIGAGAIIGPNLRVTRDVPDGARILNEEEYGRL